MLTRADYPPGQNGRKKEAEMYAGLCEQNLQSDASEEDGIGRVGEGKEGEGVCVWGDFSVGERK